MSDTKNRQALQGNWDEIRGQLRSKWGQLTSDDLQTFNGNVDQLVGLIQRKTGEARSSVENFLDELTTSGAPEATGIIGRFELREKLGTGRFGTVYLAHDRLLDRNVALKIPALSAASNEERQRFLREARAAARLQHPGIVPVYEAGDAKGITYLATEYVKGEDLSSILDAKGSLPLRDAVEIARQVAVGLEFAHGQGVVHRDIKPSNVFLRQSNTENRAVAITDFGLGMHLADAERRLMATRQCAGTFAYMPPEILSDAGAVSPLSDVYSLGCTLYQLATGRLPISGESQMETIAWHSSENTPPRLSSIVPDSPRALDSLLQRMLAKRPEERPAMSGVAAELGKIGRDLSDSPSEARDIQSLSATQAPVADLPSPDMCVGLSLTVSILAALAASLLAWNLTVFLVLAGVLVGIHASLWLFVEGFKTTRSSVFRLASFIAGCFLLWEVMQLLTITLR
jgi:eukaryotic-like serine/threonine-protein kinase